MPGIYGIYTNAKTKFNTKSILSDMGNALNHFDFYSNIQFDSDCIGLGQVGVGTGYKTSFYKESKKGFVVGFDGKIYSFPNKRNDLIESSLESEKYIVNLFNKYKYDIPSKLNGDFNLVIFNPSEHELLIFNDRFGNRHLYYYIDSQFFAFAPEIKALLTIPEFEKKLDTHGIADYFNFSYQFSDRTFFEKVKLLPPASFLQYKNGKVLVRNYWKPRYDPTFSIKDIDNAAKIGFDLFVQSIERNIKGKNKVFIPVSGGLDSRLILAITKNYNINFQTATFDVAGGLESKIARKVTKKLGLEKPILVKIESDWIKKYGAKLGYINEAKYGTLGSTTIFGFFDQLGKEYDGLLNGIFGGHISFGSPYFNSQDIINNISTADRKNRIIKGLNGHLFRNYLAQGMNEDWVYDINNLRDITIDEQWNTSSSISDLDIFRQDYIFIYNRIRRGMNGLDLNRYFIDSLLPFASYELYEFYLSLSPELMINHNLYKTIYKKYLPEMASIPWAATGVNLYKRPSRISKNYQAFKNELRWYSTRLTGGKFNLLNRNSYNNNDAEFRRNKQIQQWVKNILLSEQTINRGFFNYSGIMNILKKEMNGYDLFEQISQLVLFELFMRNFID
jgi:hypothetical protein